MASTIARRTQSPFADLMDWLEGEVPFGLKRTGLSPSVAIEDFIDDGTYVVRAELPGVDPAQDVTVAIDNDVLTIRGERREVHEDKRFQEIQYGSFSRSVRVPPGTKTEDIDATYRDGVLEVRVPMAAAEETARVIEIKRAD